MDFKKALGIDLSDPKFIAALEDVEEYERVISTLVAARKHQKLTQTQVADALQTTQPVISELERLAGNPSVTRLMEYARAVGQRLQFFTSGSTAFSAEFDQEYQVSPEEVTASSGAVNLDRIESSQVALTPESYTLAAAY